MGNYNLVKTIINSYANDPRYCFFGAWLGALVIGGNRVVDGASGLALKIGMSQAMVALTVVDIGNMV
ncbi:MAG: hypothetical protein K2L17_03430 [Muribaculaceae bacterium]|nr:hypothetical protein [Muribaculaceae bacterium]